MTTVRVFSINAGLEASTVTPGSSAPGESLTTPAMDPCARASVEKEENCDNERPEPEWLHALSCGSCEGFPDQCGLTSLARDATTACSGLQVESHSFCETPTGGAGLNAHFWIAAILILRAADNDDDAGSWSVRFRRRCDAGLRRWGRASGWFRAAATEVARGPARCLSTIAQLNLRGSPMPPPRQVSTSVHFNGMTGEFYYPEVIAPGVALFDYDNDGDLDVFLTTGTEAWLVANRIFLFNRPSRLPPAGLFRNDLTIRPDGAHVKAIHRRHRGQRHARQPAMAWGVAVGDYNNDGCPDLYVTDSVGIKPAFETIAGRLR